MYTKLKEFPNYYINEDGIVVSIKGFLKQGVCKNGYYVVSLRKGNKSYKKYVHRLVAETFIPNPQNKKSVNHIDGNKLNPKISNLEWATHREQMQHAFENKLMAEKLLNQRVKVINISNNFIGIFNSQWEAARYLGFINQSKISECLLGKRKSYKGYTFYRV